MQAIVLVGSFGTRLKHVVADVPKPMAPISERPFLAYLLDYLISHGVTELVLSVHHMREHIMNYFGSSYNGVSVHYAIEEQPLGTGGGIQLAMQQLSGDESVLAMNDDSLVMLDHEALYQQHIKSNKPATLALRQMPDCSRYGKVLTEGGVITSFKADGSEGPGFINAGVYVLDKDVFTLADLPDAFSIEHDFFSPYIGILKPDCFSVDEYFIDIGVPDDYARAQQDLPGLLVA